MGTRNGAINCSSVYVQLFLLFCYCFCRCLPDFTLGDSDIYRKLRMCIDHVLKAEHSMASFRPPRHCPHLAVFFLWGRQLFAL